MCANSKVFGTLALPRSTISRAWWVKTEAGKTALLTAFTERARFISNDGKFDLSMDYPKREVENYRISVENEERPKTVVVESTYELSDNDAGCGSGCARR